MLLCFTGKKIPTQECKGQGPRPSTSYVATLRTPFPHSPTYLAVSAYFTCCCHALQRT